MQKALLKIDFSKGEAQLLSSGKDNLDIKKLFFKISVYKFFVTFTKIGNFCSINNFYVPLQNNCWDLNLDKFFNKCFNYLDDVLVLTNLPSELKSLIKDKKILILKQNNSPKEFKEFKYDQQNDILALTISK